MSASHDLKIGVSSPLSVTQAEVTILRWRYLDVGEAAGETYIEYTEIWRDGKRIGTNKEVIGVTGAKGPSSEAGSSNPWPHHEAPIPLPGEPRIVQCHKCKGTFDLDDLEEGLVFANGCCVR